MPRCLILRFPKITGLVISTIVLVMLILATDAQDIQFLDDTKNDRIYYPDKQRLNFGRHTYGRPTTESNEIPWWQGKLNFGNLESGWSE